MSSTFVLQRLRWLDPKRPSRRDDACEYTAQDRRQREDRRATEIIEVHIRQVVVGETERQDCTNPNAQRNLNGWSPEDGSQDVQRLRAERDAYADLPRPPGDGEGRHRIDTGERQYQRHARQADQELQPERTWAIR